MSDQFEGKTMVVRVDEASLHASGSTFVDDLQILTGASVRPVVVAPQAACAREIVRTINRSANTAVALSGSDAAMLPGSADGIGRVQTGILETLLAAGYIPVIEPTVFAVFSSLDAQAAADDVAACVAGALDAVRAIFFHASGGVSDPQTNTPIEELTAAEALALAEDPRLAPDLRAAMRAAALGVRSGVGAAQIIDGRVPHATVVELLTARHVGTQVTGGIVPAA
jgi:acetylglutamate kinase